MRTPTAEDVARDRPAAVIAVTRHEAWPLPLDVLKRCHVSFVPCGSIASPRFACMLT